MSSNRLKPFRVFGGALTAVLLGTFILAGIQPVHGVTSSEARKQYRSVSERSKNLRRKFGRLSYQKRRVWYRKWQVVNRDIIQARRNWSRKRYSTSVRWTNRAKAKLVRLEREFASRSGKGTKPTRTTRTKPTRTTRVKPASGKRYESAARSAYNRANSRVLSLKTKLFKLAPKRRNKIYNRMARVFSQLRRAKNYLRARRWSQSLAASNDVNRRMNVFERDYKRMMATSTPTQRKDENLRKGCPKGEFYMSKQCHHFAGRVKMSYKAAKAYCKTRHSSLMYWRYIGARYVLQKGVTAYKAANINMENKPVWLGRDYGEKGPYRHGIVKKGRANKVIVANGSQKAYAFCSARNRSSRNKKFR